mgnify:CR=1 FL=1
MKKVISMLLAVFIIFAGAMTAAGEKLVTPEELGQIKKAADIDQSLTITAKSAILTERSTGTVLFEHDGVAIHKDLQLGVSVQMHTGAQLLGQNDAAQRIDAADDSGTFHSIPFSFILFL